MKAPGIKVVNAGGAVSAVEVAAPARLHMGFLDLGGGLGRRFGSIGVALQRPLTRVLLDQATEPRATGPDCARALRYARRFADHFGIETGFALTVDEAIPAHSGLGSGTQMALAVGTAMAEMFGIRISTAGIGALYDRGARSAIGINVFDDGGFVIDGGRDGSSELPPRLFRCPVPDGWRFLLIMDPDRQGVSGNAEVEAFEKLKPFPETDAAHICRLTLMQLLPAITRADWRGFGTAVSDIQRRIGDYFAAIQGGRFASPSVAAVFDWLESRGMSGYGQTSWGPTGFVLCPNARRGDDLKEQIESRFGSDLELCLVAPRNAGARVRAAAGRLARAESA